ncbi:MAG: hypothetical protein FJW21_04755 [Acidimicrobiia bacterium]|nr:hypothetical protein [Acidimicrobiia bacterium]
MAASYLTALSRAAGPACIGVAVWCAVGLVTVESAASASVRLVAPAPWWIAVAGFVIAWLVPGWRRSPLTALPALLATLPWWPVPLPTAVLLWTGPLAWLPILAALGAAEGSRSLGAIARVIEAHDPRRATVIAALLTGVLGVATLSSIGGRLPGGDEPHYLVITQSLLRDGDLRIENNHTQGDYAEYFGGTLRPDYINRGQDGEIYSIHAPGVSALVLPAYAAFGFRGAQATILLVLMITAALVWRLAWLATANTGAAWFAWAGVMGSATTVLLGVMVFPDSPAAVGSAAGVWLLVALARNGELVPIRHVVAVSAVLAGLPWLHTRFAVVAAGFGLAILIAMRGRRLVAFLTVPALSAAAWFLQFWLIYGTVDPRAPYRGAENIREWIWGAAAGLFTDQQFGLVVFAPVLLAGFVGFCRASSRAMRLVCLASVLILAAYTMAAASYHMWWAGLPGLPARFLTAVVPLFALPLAIGWARATSAGRAVLLAMLGVSWLTTALVVGYDNGVFAFNFRDGQAAWLEWLNPVANLPRAWPSFFWASQGAFLTHVGVQLAAWGLGWLVLRTFVRRHIERADVGRVAVALWVMVGLMFGATAGWRLTGVTGLDPARSQLAIHAEPRVWRVAPFTVRRASTAFAMTVHPDEPPLSDNPTSRLMLVGPVPAGDYHLEVTGAVIRESTITATIGRSPSPLHVFPLSPEAVSSGFTAPLSLPAGATALVLEADSPESAAGLHVALRPTSPAVPSGVMARRSAPDGDATVFFVDDEVFVEPTGFWVRGGRETQVVWSAGAALAGRPRTIRLQNGGAANTVTVRMGGWIETVTLEPWQEQMVMVPAADATGAWRLGIASASGFQPSEVSGGDDRRYLGVWVGK